MAILRIGPMCARRGCERPPWKDTLCCRCWRLSELFGRDPRMFAYEPIGGYRDDRDAVQLPWDRWQEEASARGGDIVSLFADASDDGPSSARSRT